MRWVRQGVISKAWLGTGEEAATVGPVFALDPAADYVAPMIRNAAACADMGMPLADMFRAYLATADSPSAGRDLHVGSPGPPRGAAGVAGGRDGAGVRGHRAGGADPRHAARRAELGRATAP